MTATGLEENHLVSHLIKTFETNDWAVLWVVICTVHLTVCYFHVTYAFKSESITYSCLNVKELLARNNHDIWNLSDINGIWTHNHLVRKRTLNHLAKLVKWLSVRLRTNWLWVRISLLSIITPWACLLRSGTKLMFHWSA